MLQGLRRLGVRPGVRFSVALTRTRAKAAALTKQITLTADYQFVTNPAYNADRGPVHIFSGRLHGEF